MAWLSVCWGLTLCLTTTTTTNSATTSDTTTAVNTGARRADVQARLDDSSSRPVAPIEPLMDLGGRGAAPPGPLQPVFDEAAPRSVSSLSGGTAYLHCVVHHLGGGSVSWIRRRDLHILTVGTYTYTTDQRFEVVHAAASRDWILKLRYAQERDSGLYDCQVSRRPVLTYSVRLSVYAAPSASIVGAPDMHVDRGSTINLTCTVTHTSEPSAYIFWYHNGQVVNYESPRGGVTVVTERGNVTRGFLLIQDARPSDSGNYTCAPSNTAPSWLRVHVLNVFEATPVYLYGLCCLESRACKGEERRAA
ncbi:zwei Ig domain protein zig-8-like isoform X1 [Scylla paramamosain]|uniref:zwei Ig domain protein zig-8-like isoform X1 n=1 Tax=Scylla paramamosain TaxID=85552 RepID=UPI0030832871